MRRKRYSVEEKTRIALEAIRGRKTLNELAAEYGVHPSQIPNVEFTRFYGDPKYSGEPITCAETTGLM